jgi:hypothetical protein
VARRVPTPRSEEATVTSQLCGCRPRSLDLSNNLLNGGPEPSAILSTAFMLGITSM